MKIPPLCSFLSMLLLALLFNSCAESKPVASKAVAAPAAKATVSANVAPGLETQILTLINQHRKKKGLRLLENNYIISTVARNHTMAMATRRVAFGHSGMDARAKYIRAKIKGVKAVAENVAYGSTTAEGVVEQWLNSPGHRKNIEGNYRLTGIGVARDVNSRLYYTQIFSD